ARWRSSRGVVTVTVGRQQPEILLISLPRDVAGVGARDAGEPIGARALLVGLLPVDRPPVGALAVRVGARVPRVAQRPHRGRCRERTEDDTPVGGAEPRGEAEALISKRFDRLVRRASPDEGLEEVRDRLPHLCIRIKDDSTALIVDETRGENASVLTAPGLIQDPAA